MSEHTQLQCHSHTQASFVWGLHSQKSRKVLIAIVFFVVLFSYAVVAAWRTNAPSIHEWSTSDYLQAAGLAPNKFHSLGFWSEPPAASGARFRLLSAEEVESQMLPLEHIALHYSSGEEDGFLIFPEDMVVFELGARNLLRLIIENDDVYNAVFWSENHYTNNGVVDNILLRKPKLVSRQPIFETEAGQTLMRRGIAGFLEEHVGGYSELVITLAPKDYATYAPQR